MLGAVHGRRSGVRLLLVVFAALAALAWAPSAFATAGTVSYDVASDTTSVTDGAGQDLTVQVNFGTASDCLTYWPGGQPCDVFTWYYSSSPSVSLTTSSPYCAAEPASKRILCSAASNYVANLGDGDDTLNISNEVYFKTLNASLGSGNDTLNASNISTAVGYPGTTTVDGGPGDDHLYAGPANDVLHGGDGSDRLFGGPGNDKLYGDGGNDGLLLGGPGNDLIDGGDGDDLYLQCLDGPAINAVDQGADTFVGGPGNDRMCYEQRGSGVSISLDGVANDGEPGENDNVGSDIEEIDGSPNNDQLTGNDQPNTIFGAGGSDTIDGRGGNDKLVGSAGDDTITGGSGQDSIYGDGLSCGGICDLGNDTIYARDGEIDQVVCGPGSDIVTADGSDVVDTGPLNGCESITRPAKPACIVPKVTGKTLAGATSALTKAHCRLGKVTKRFSAKVKKGRVISGSPARGKHLKNLAKVNLVLSRGRKH